MHKYCDDYDPDALDYWEREYYSKIPSKKKENAGYHNDFLEVRKMINHTKRRKDKKKKLWQMPRREAKKEIRNFDRHREIDEEMTNYLMTLYDYMLD